MQELPFGLNADPFAAGQDSRFIDATPDRRDTVAELRDALERGESFLLVTGEPGVGKTSAVIEACAGAGPGRSLALVTNPPLARSELLEQICIRLGVLLDEGRSVPQMLERIEQHLGEVRSRGETIVLMIDEAHLLPPDLLEELRRLTNLQSEGRALLQIVLVGLPELEARLARPGMEPLLQRIGLRRRLNPLSRAETESYIHHRVSAAGRNGAELFPHDTCREIHRLTRGIPRAINTLCALSMKRAVHDESLTVVAEHVRQAASESWIGSIAQDAVTVPHPAFSSPPPAAPAESAPTTRTESVTVAAAGVRPAPAGPRPISREPGTRSDAEVRDWVARFAGSGPPRIGSMVALDERFGPRDVEDSPSPVEATPDVPARRPAATRPRADEEEPATEPRGPRGPRRPREPGPARRGPSPARGGGKAADRPDPSRYAFAATAAILVVTAVVILALRGANGRGFSPRTPARRAPVADSQAIAVAPRTDVSPPVARAAIPDGGRREAASETARGRATVAAGTAAGGEALEAEPAPAVRRTLGLEVATYIQRDRAELEASRLSESTGLRSRILVSSEYGGTSYRVVLGAFDRTSDAEQAAASLVEQGLLDQARVVTLSARDLRSE